MSKVNERYLKNLRRTNIIALERLSRTFGWTTVNDGLELEGLITESMVPLTQKELSIKIENIDLRVPLLLTNARYKSGTIKWLFF